MSDGRIAWSPDGTDNWRAGCTEARYPDGRMREECMDAETGKRKAPSKQLTLPARPGKE